MKADNTWQSALVYSDWLREKGDDTSADKWTTIGRIQYNAALLWAKYGKAWTPTDLRQMPMMLRTKNRKFEVNGQVYILEMWFAHKQVIVSLYARGETGSRWSDGFHYSLVGETAFLRYTLAKHGVDACLRKVSLRLLEKKETGVNAA